MTVTFFSTKRILNIAPAVALRPGMPKANNKCLAENLPFWSKLNFSTRYNLRDISRNKLRTLLGLTGTTLCMALILCGLTAKDNFSVGLMNLYFKGMLNNSSIITIKEDTPVSELTSIKNKLNGELIMSDSIEMRLPNSSTKYTYHMNVYENGSIGRVLDTNYKKTIISPNDFTITMKAANKFGVKVGDKIQWHVYDSPVWITSTITKITRSPFEQGILIGKNILDENNIAFTPTRLLTQQNIPDEITSSPYIQSISKKENAADSFASFTGMLNMVLGFLIIFAIFLAVTVLYCLGLLTFEERLKELSVLKVIGLSSKKISSLMMTQNFILSLIGSIIGMPVGYLILKLMLNSLGDTMDIPANLSPSLVIASLIITVVICIAVNLLFNKRIRKLDLVAEIKCQE